MATKKRAGRPKVATPCPYCKRKIPSSKEFRAHIVKCPERAA